MHRFLLHTLPLVLVTVSSSHVCGDDSLRRVAAVLGFTPTSLTVSGLSVAEVTAVLSHLRSSTELQAVLTAELDVKNQERALANVLQTIDSLNPLSAEFIEQAALARDMARAALVTAIDAAIATVTQPLSSAQRLRLAAWRNSPHSLSAALRVVPWSVSDLCALEAALLEERIAQTSQTHLSPECAGLLLQTRSRPEVVDAEVRLESQLAVIKAAYLQATH